jgi:hypothetical protein
MTGTPQTSTPHPEAEERGNKVGTGGKGHVGRRGGGEDIGTETGDTGRRTQPGSTQGDCSLSIPEDLVVRLGGQRGSDGGEGKAKEVKGALTKLVAGESTQRHEHWQQEPRPSLAPTPAIKGQITQQSLAKKGGGIPGATSPDPTSSLEEGQVEGCYACIVHENPTGGVTVCSREEAEELVLDLLSRRSQNRPVRTSGQVLGTPNTPPIGSRREDLSAEDTEESVPASQLL